MEIRAAVAADLDDVVTLEARAFGDGAWSPRAVEAEFALVGETRSIAVAVEGGSLLGYGVLMYVGDTADVPRVAVAPESRRRGVGTGIVDALVRRAAELGCTEVLLEVADDNGAARALYAAAGFAEISRRPGYYGGGVDAIVMRRPLEGAAHG